MDALSTTSLAMPGSPSRRRHTVAMAVAGVLALVTALICLVVAVGSRSAEDVSEFGAIGLALPAWVVWRIARAVPGSAGRLTIGADELIASDPHVLREPLTIPRASVRAAAVERDDRAARRFRIHSSSGPYSGGGRDGWLWARGRGSAVPALTREATDEPNVALIFETPVAVPRLRARRAHVPLAGERMGGLLLRVDDPAAAEEALDRLGVLRPLTAPDGLALAAGLGVAAEPPAGSRRALLARRTQRIGWLMVAGSAVVPLSGAFAALAGVSLWHGGRRRAGGALVVSGTLACVARTATLVL
jgi:hypothetical protein